MWQSASFTLIHRDNYTTQLAFFRIAVGGLTDLWRAEARAD
jgi:hypothetical protein